MPKQSYILQKDLPKTKAGMRFMVDELLASFGTFAYSAEDKSTSLFSDHVENNPEWFLPEVEVLVEKKYVDLDMLDFAFYAIANAKYCFEDTFKERVESLFKEYLKEKSK